MVEVIRVTQLVVLLLSIVAVAVVMRRVAGGKIAQIRKLAGLDALAEAVGRAVETGRSIHATTGFGYGTFQSDSGPQHLAGLSVISHVADSVAKYNANMIVSLCPPEAIPIVQESLKNAYMAAGFPEKYKPTMIRFFGTNQWGYTIGVTNLLLEDKPAANIMIGGILAESLIFAEAGYSIGAIQIAGTANFSQIPFFIVACDYTLIGEEIYAVSAYLTKNPDLIASLSVQDLMKFASSFMIILLAILSTLKIPWLANLLKM